MTNANRDTRLFDAMIVLKRHLRSCRTCQSARKAGDAYAMCRPGIGLVLAAADRYDMMVTLRAAALSSSTGAIFACPDTSKHGKSYALLAVPVHVTAVQESLF